MPEPRLFTAMVTPFDDQGEVDYQKAGDLAVYLTENGSDGIVVCGTTGESPVLTNDEKLKLFAVVKERVGDKAQVIANTGSYNTKASIEMSIKAQNLGVDGLMAITPYYNKPSQEGLYLHFKAIADAVSLPIMIYNVPGRTGVNLLPETLARLAEIKNITSVKEACGDLDQVSRIKTLVPKDFVIYSGDDSLTLPILAVGGSGIVSVVSHIVGNDLKAMIDAYFAGQVEKACQLHTKLFPIFKGMFIISNPVPIKEAMNLMGMKVGGFRLPLAPAPEKEREYIRKLLIDYGLIS
ncbi:MAG: 4-hydroxy-tetrahydrodipicolinate synthase [Syntrophomonadaceae bacterium]|jgi:4-hydroxy-tetrahydrodipicolinate synthase